MRRIEIKYYLQKKKLWIAVICVFLSCALLALNLSENNSIEQKELQLATEDFMQKTVFYIPYEFNRNFNSEEEFDQFIKEVYPENYAFIMKLNDVYNHMYMYFQQKDMKSINHGISEIALMHAYRIGVNYDHVDTRYISRDYIQNKEVVEKLYKQLKLPNYVYDDLTLQSIGSFSEKYEHYTGSDEAEFYPYFQLMGRFYHELDKQGIEQLTYSTVDSSTIILQFFRNFCPLIIILLVSLMFFDSIFEDQETGVIKTIISQPISRLKYLNKKIFANISISLAVILVPLLILVLGLGVFDHFETINAPVLANTEGITSLAMVENPAADPLTNEMITKTLGLSEYFPIPQALSSPVATYDLMPLWQFNLLCFLNVMMIIIFCVMLNMLLNVIFKNKMASLVLSVIIILGGSVLVNVANYDIIYAMIPFTFMNPVNILSGFSSYTYLNGILVLGIYSVIFYLLTIAIFKRKDIA